MKKLTILFTLLFISTMLSACGKSKNTNVGSTNLSGGEAVKTDISTNGMDFEFTSRDTDYGYDESTAVTVDENEDTVRITAAGTYVVTGNHSQIIISAPDTAKIQIVLKNAVISNRTGPAVYITGADKVFLTAYEGTQNTVSDAADYSPDYTGSNVDAAVFSKADLTVNGKGTLNVTGGYQCGIVSKDDLIISGLTLNITSTGRALEGKDCVKCADATVNITAGGDGIKATNTKDSSRGYVYIESGSYRITSENDAIQAETALNITGGDFRIKTGGGAPDTTALSDYGRGMWGGKPEDITQTETGESAKAIKSSLLIRIDGGNFAINSCDDAVHSNSDAEINGGDFRISSGNDGIHADDALIINGGNIIIEGSYEGLEGTAVTISGGTLDVTAHDDGINAAGGNDSSSLGGRPGENTFNSTSNTVINITGGYILLNAAGDGVDSNGAVAMSGGVLLVSGPTDSGNSALDYEAYAAVTGGTAILCGSAGMAQGFSDNSSQPSFMYTLNSSTGADSSIAVTDSSGNVIASFMPSKQYGSIVVSSPALTVGGSYTVTIGGTVSGCDKNGYADAGRVSGETDSFSVEISSVSAAYGSPGGMGADPGIGGKPDRGMDGGKRGGMR